MRLEPAVLATELRDLLGAKLVAYLGDLKDTREIVQTWFHGLNPCAGRPVARAAAARGRLR